MTPTEFAWLRDFLRARSGLDLSGDKAYLAECRLAPVARQAGLSSLSQLLSCVALDGDPRLSSCITEAMTTNESSFFRDRFPFENFRQIMLPHLLQARRRSRRIRIWSAAAASGQEPYSLAMLIREEKGRLAGWHVDILASDLSKAMVARGKAGRYTQFEVQRGLPIQLLVKYFRQQQDFWDLDRSVCEMVRWQVFNLLHSYHALGTFDVVFCRNVLIYFDRKTKADVLSRLADTLEPDGYLVLGSAETVVGLTDRFEPVAGAYGLYRRVAPGAVPRALLQVAQPA